MHIFEYNRGKKMKLKEALNKDALKKIAKTAEVFGHETRLLISMALLEGKKKLGQIVDWVNKPYPSVIQHLNVLIKAGFVTIHRAGRHADYSLLRQHLVKKIISTICPAFNCA